MQREPPAAVILVQVNTAPEQKPPLSWYELDSVRRWYVLLRGPESAAQRAAARAGGRRASSAPGRPEAIGDPDRPRFLARKCFCCSL